MDASIHARISDAYETVAYVGHPHREAAPAYLRAVGRLHGLPLPDPARLAMLEIGSGDGAHLLPLAAAHPQGRFVGIDGSSLLTAAAREMAAGLGLANLELIEADLRALPASIGRFDVVVAHGMYSWLPPDVRDAILAAIGRHLAPGGVAFVSCNTLPGHHLRRIGFDAMRFHVRGIADPAARVAAAREFIDLLVETWRAQPAPGPAVAANFARESARDDGGLFHDDLAAINDAVYVSAFAGHAAAHGLVAFADADAGAFSAGGASDEAIARWRARGAGYEAQMLDFVHMRQFRQMLCTPAGTPVTPRPDPARVRDLHWSATPGYMLKRLAGETRADPLGDWFAERYPAVLPWSAIDAALGLRVHDLAARVEAARVAGVLEPFAWAVPVASRPGPLPRAGAVARWQAQRRERVTSLRHFEVKLEDDFARRLLALCDGTRNRDALARALAASGAAPAGANLRARVDRGLAQFASAALLEA